MNKIYMITVNNKKFDEWSKKTKVQLKRRKNPMALEHFNQGYNDVARGNYLARATFVCYWEIYANNNLARLAPAITQASMIHLFHRFLEAGQEEEAKTVQMMMSNFLRLLQAVDMGSSDEEE